MLKHLNWSRTSTVSGPPMLQHLHCCRTSTNTVNPLFQDIHCWPMSNVEEGPLLQDIHCNRISTLKGHPLPKHLCCHRISIVTELVLYEQHKCLRTSTVTTPTLSFSLSPWSLPTPFFPIHLHIPCFLSLNCFGILSARRPSLDGHSTIYLQKCSPNSSFLSKLSSLCY